MTREDFKQWRKQLSISQERAAQLLDISHVTVAKYETIGSIPKTVELACIALDIAHTFADLTASEKPVSAAHAFGMKKNHFIKEYSIFGNLQSVLKTKYIHDT